MELAVILVLLLGIALAAPRYGVDSRWRGQFRPDDPVPPLQRRHTIVGDLTLLARRMSSFLRRGSRRSSASVCRG